MMVSARALSLGSGFAGPRAGSAVADAADRRLDAGYDQALGVADRDVLAAAVAMVHQALLQISEFPTGNFGSNRQAVSAETDRPFRSKAAPHRQGFSGRLWRTAAAE
jgi:hypothetical protein